MVTAEGEIEDLTKGMAHLKPLTDVWLDPEVLSFYEREYAMNGSEGGME